jgi:3-dehydroquinate dehydratase-2
VTAKGEPHGVVTVTDPTASRVRLSDARTAAEHAPWLLPTRRGTRTRAAGPGVTTVVRRMRNRVQVMHGVNLDQIGRRDPAHYGELTFSQLEQAIDNFADELNLDARFFQTNSEAEFVEHLHRVADVADGIVLNAGAWSHYSRAIGEALAFAGLPAIEVHLSDVMAREAWRRVSVLSEHCIATISGKGVDGYREALERLKPELAR